MTDKELLELAAKAAGLEFGYDSPTHCGYYSEWRGLPQWNDWNPLIDDGDALRLAVKLKIPMQFPDWKNVTRTWGPVNLIGCDELFDEPHEKDPYAATRRAIVRAAAEIGKTL